MLELGQRLKLIRGQAGFTQKDVEAKLGLRELTMKDYETGRLKLPAAMALTLAKLYRVSLEELMGEEPKQGREPTQALALSHLESFFSPSEVSLLFMDPVIRAYLDDYRDQILERSVFDLLTLKFAPRQKNALAMEMLRVLASLMGVDDKITKEELDFLRRLISHFGLNEKAKGILKTVSARHQPNLEPFQNCAAARHFLLWLLFFIAKSDGVISVSETKFIEVCAEALRVNRSSFLFIRGFFKKEKF